MNATSYASLLSCAVVAGANAAPDAAAAQTSPRVQTYVVTTLGGSAAGNVVARETLSLQGSRLQIANADGSVFSSPVVYTAKGEIASNSQDNAITCYNMAIGAAARTPDTSSDPASVFVRFGRSIVQIPLRVRATQVRGSVRDVALEGRSSGIFSTANAAVAAGIVINAGIETDGGDLRSASFDEVHFAGSPAAVVARSACTLQRVEQRPPSRASARNT